MERGRRMRWVQAMAAVGIVATWGARASAELMYPPEVIMALGLPADSTAITCATCHLSNSGGGGPSDPMLAVFGALLEQDGIASGSSEAQFVSVLAEIKATQPKAYADLLAGRDPNPDVTDAADVHTPEFGCTMGNVAKGRGSWMLALFGLASIAVWRRRAGVARKRP